MTSTELDKMIITAIQQGITLSRNIVAHIGISTRRVDHSLQRLRSNNRIKYVNQLTGWAICSTVEVAAEKDIPAGTGIDWRDFSG